MLPLKSFFRVTCGTLLVALATVVYPASLPQTGPWTAQELLSPKQAAALLLRSDRVKPVVIYAGFPVLYRSAHIPHALLAGPASKPEGLAALKRAVEHLPHDQAVLLYCGCCPFDECPNIRPAYRALRELGFTRLQVIFLETNLHTNWVASGFPVTKGNLP